MAVSLVSSDVSDLCIGKPPLRSLPLSATVGEALLALLRLDEPWLSVWTAAAPPSCVGKVCVVDVACYLCSEDNIADPRAALRSAVSVFLPEGGAPSDLIRRVDPHSSILQALDLILDGAQNLVVSIPPSPPRNKKHHHHTNAVVGVVDFCCLTQEDFVRFFLNSIGLFSTVATQSIDALGLVRPDPLVARYDDPAISLAPLLTRAAASQTAVAILADDGRLVGEVSPSALALCGGEVAAAAVAALSAGELMAFLDCAGEEAVQVVRERLLEKGMKGMVDLMDDVIDEIKEKKVPGAMLSSSSSSSSDEESSSSGTSCEGNRRGRGSKKHGRTGSYSARMGRRSEEAIVCRPGSSLVAVMMQALAHRVSYAWVVEDDYELAGVVTFPDVLRVFREHLAQQQ